MFSPGPAVALDVPVCLLSPQASVHVCVGGQWHTHRQSWINRRTDRRTDWLGERAPWHRELASGTGVQTTPGRCINHVLLVAASSQQQPPSVGSAAAAADAEATYVGSISLWVAGVTLKCLSHEKSARGVIIMDLISPLLKYHRPYKKSPCHYRIAPPQKSLPRPTAHR